MDGTALLLDCWLWEDATVMGVELRMTDKKRMGGSCDFLIDQEGRDKLFLGISRAVSKPERAVDSHEKPASAQLGAFT